MDKLSTKKLVSTITASTITLGLLLSTAHTIAADTASPSGFTISPMIGHYNFDHNRNIEADTLYSIGLGYQFDSPWALELVYLESDTKFKDSDMDLDLEQIRLDALYNLNRNGDIQPYFAFGIGENKFDIGSNDADETLINAGFGLKYYFTQNLSLRGDFRLINSLDDEETDAAFSVGFHYVFGGHKKSIAAKKTAPQAQRPATDSDGDGVPDSSDKCPGSEPGAKVDSTGCYIMLKEDRSIVLNVNFGTNSADVNAGYESNIADLAEFMIEYPQTKVTIEGHTDDTGAASYNQNLSERRAQSVATVLVEKYNINATRVSSRGYGESAPLFDSSVDGYRNKNRRVVAAIKTTIEVIQK